MIRIHGDFRAKRAWNQVRKNNACLIREVSADCIYGLHHSVIHGIVRIVRGFAWPFAVWLHIVRFREVQRCVLRTGHRMWRSKSPERGKSPVPHSIRSTRLSYVVDFWLHSHRCFSCYALCKIVISDIPQRTLSAFQMGSRPSDRKGRCGLHRG